jgi:N-acetylneuraminic acid mutarotase
MITPARSRRWKWNWRRSAGKIRVKNPVATSIGCLALILSIGCSSAPRGISWSWGPVMPLAKSCRATAVAGDGIITVGGTWWERAPEKKIKHWASVVYLLDTNKMEWRRLPDYPLPVGYAFSGQIGNRLYVIGGRSEDRGNAETFILDLFAKDQKWVPGPSLPRPRWGHAGGIINGIIYIAGGSEGDPSRKDGNSLANSVLAFDPREPAKGWRPIAALPRHGTEWQMSAVCGSKLYLLGGLVSTTEGDKGFLPQTDVLAFDVSKNLWEQLRPLPTPMGSGAAVAIDSRYILMTGGYGLAVPGASTPDHKARTHFTSDCLLYDVARNNYRFLTAVKMPVADQGLVYVKKKIFMIGGEDAPYQTRTDTVQIGELF